jgi:hypothetical protein
MKLAIEMRISGCSLETKRKKGFPFVAVHGIASHFAGGKN